MSAAPAAKPAPAAVEPAAEVRPDEAKDKSPASSPVEERATGTAGNGDATAEGPAEPIKTKAADGPEEAADKVDEPDAMPRLPDDPGVDPNDVGEPQRRFRLF